MKRTWTIIGVRDVPGSFRWYRSLLGQPETPPVHDDFGQILDTDGTVLLCLHQWGAHEHPSLMSPDEGPLGNGLLLFFRVDDYDTALNRARALVARFEEEPHVNPNTQTKEFSLRDPDGYYVTISARSSPQRRGFARAFWRRTLTHFGISLGLLGVSLLAGIWGYQYYEHLPWRDAFLNAAMLLGGMGPVKTDLSESGKIFAGLYALFAGLVVIAVAGLLLGPGVHHLMHHVHWDDTPEGK